MPCLMSLVTPAKRKVIPQEDAPRRKPHEEEEEAEGAVAAQKAPKMLCAITVEVKDTCPESVENQKYPEGELKVVQRAEAEGTQVPLLGESPVARERNVTSSISNWKM